MKEYSVKDNQNGTYTIKIYHNGQIINQDTISREFASLEVDRLIGLGYICRSVSRNEETISNR